MWRLVVATVLVVWGCHPAPRAPPAMPAAPGCGPGARVAVLGQVSRPGFVACRAGMRLVDALIAAGGFTQLAWRNHIQVRRANRVYIVHVEEILERRAPDPVLAPGDEIFVEERDV